MIEVVAGVIYKNNKFLIAQRNLKKAQGGLWEFPGGKVENNESKESALIREIKEEFDADIKVDKYIGETIHHYPEKDIKLIFYKAILLSDKVTLIEHENYKWITKKERDNFEFAGADQKIFDLIEED